MFPPALFPSMTVGSVCSGIGAPECAWKPLGWRFAWSSDIEPFPNAVRAHHWPHVPNLGDMTTIGTRVLAGEVEAPDVLVGGTPCQSFSVAGLRQGLADARGNLAMEFIRLANAIDAVRRHRGLQPCIVLWENVPGVLSHRDNPFGCFLTGLVGEDSTIVPPRGGWTNAGVVLGPERAAAWRVLDAQYFGLPQRRSRVFVVASARTGFDPGAVLLESEGVRRDTPPRREAWEDAAKRPGCGAPDGGGAFISSGLDGGRLARALNACPTAADRHDISVDTFIAGTLPAAGSATQQDVESGLSVPHQRGRAAVSSGLGWWTDSDVGATLRAQDSVTKADTLISECIAFSAKDHGADATVDCSPTLRAMANGDGNANGGGQVAVCVSGDVAFTLRSEGFDASEDGTGHGTPIISVHGTQDPDVSEGVAHPLGRNYRQENALVIPAGTESESGIAFATRGSNLDVSDGLAATMTGNADRASGGAQCVVFAAQQFARATEFLPQSSRVYSEGEIAPTLQATGTRNGNRAPQVAGSICAASFEGGAGGRPEGAAAGHFVPTGMAVRRLTPRECERLQGFPDDWTNITFRGKPAADGPRYRALGNSMAVPCMGWIGFRIGLETAKAG